MEYLFPSFAGDAIEARTWIESVRRVRSLRRYEFVRQHDGKVLVKGETDWVFVDRESGKPTPIPDEVRGVFPS